MLPKEDRLLLRLLISIFIQLFCIFMQSQLPIGFPCIYYQKCGIIIVYYPQMLEFNPKYKVKNHKICLDKNG